MSDGNIPVLYARGDSIPEAWENSVVELYNNGLWYHRQGPKDKGKLQVDSTMIIEITNPDSDLFMHKYMTCGIEDLLEYEMEMHGAKDSWRKDLNDPADTRWDYLYHERLASYPGTKGEIDQLEFVVDRLSTTPWIRRINAITWVPEIDMESNYPPCLQNLWFSVVPAGNDSFKLNMNCRFRSRNPMIAAPMNMIGLYALQCTIRDQVIERTGMNLTNGRIVDMNDSYHISSGNQQILKDFLERLHTSKSKGEGIAKRSYDRKYVFDYMNDIRLEIEQKIIDQTKKYLSGEELKAEIEKIKQISAGRERKC